MRRDRGYWVRVVRFGVFAIAVGLVGVAVGSELLISAIYVHNLTHPGCGGSGLLPADVGIHGAQDISYLSHDGLTLQAWYLPSQNGASIILLPGWGAARDGMLREAAILSRHGYGLLMTEMRSCGHPEGQSTLGHLEARDLPEAVSWILAQPGVVHTAVLGFSLGGATATLGAAEDERIEAVVAEGGFHDLGANFTTAGDHAPLWEVAFYQLAATFFRREIGVDAHDISPISVIDRISPRPLLLIYGELEIGSGPAQEQLARAGDPRELWIVPGAWHGGYLDVAAEEWERRVVAFFDQALLSES